jgi:hypothetical protein
MKEMVEKLIANFSISRITCGSKRGDEGNNTISRGKASLEVEERN